jgi:hypothetical protein
VLIEVDDGPDRIDFGGSIYLAISAEQSVASRRSRIYGGRDWVRLGAVELGLDCLRRYLHGLPITERTDSSGLIESEHDSASHRYRRPVVGGSASRVRRS